MRKYGDIGSDTFNVWAKTLRYFNDEQIKAALKADVLRESDWPPELKSFVSLCNAHRPDPMHTTHKALPVLKSDKDYAAPWREQLRAVLGLGERA